MGRLLDAHKRDAHFVAKRWAMPEAVPSVRVGFGLTSQDISLRHSTTHCSHPCNGVMHVATAFPAFI